MTTTLSSLLKHIKVLSLLSIIGIDAPFNKGKRLPEWLIKELIEKDRIQAKEEALMGRELTSEEVIVKPGETVKEFIGRTWNK